MSEAPAAHGPDTVDVLVIGGGPSGMKAAVQGAKAGRRVLLVERDAAVGGECVHRGTIPSKTLRETASHLLGLRRRSGGVIDADVPQDLKVTSLMRRLKAVLSGHEAFLANQLQRNGIERWRGRARFAGPNEVVVEMRDGTKRRVTAEFVVVATGSRPRRPPEIPIDHENVLDSDSILSLIYVPRSLTVLGAGVIACEFASVFSALGTRVTMVDRRDRPLGFLDRELCDTFTDAFEREGGTFLPGRSLRSVRWDGLSSVQTVLDDGETLRSEKLLCAMGRVANVGGLRLEKIGIELDERGHVPVDEFGRTALPHVYAVGDVVGPPALAATAMEQGRRAVRHALGQDLGAAPEMVPVGIYTIPEIACVGLDRRRALERHGRIIVGKARFDELARGHISGDTEGLLELICDHRGEQILGVQVVGERATELVHVGQMAMAGGLGVDALLEHTFNFPTLAEAYRVAALDAVGKRPQGLRRAG